MVIREKSFWAPASCDLGGIAAFRRFRELVDWADIMHFHFPWPFADLLNWAVRSRKPKILTYHSDIIRQKLLGALYAPLMANTLRSMDAVIATSPAYATTSAYLRRNVSPDRLRVIPLGIEDRINTPLALPDIDHWLGRWGIAGQPYVLALGVLRYYKGLHTLIDAAAAIQGMIVIAGTGPEEKNLQEQIARRGVKNIIFVGQVSDDEKTVLLSHCRALVLASHLRSEAFGMVLVEASMHGKPMVCCEVGTGTSFVNAHNETGFVISPENHVELAQAINTLLLETELARSMGRAARKRYECLFSGNALGQAYADLYWSVIG